jgi:enoyl-CoA hydratase/carnithine racemase
MSMLKETVQDEIKIVTLSNGKTNPFNREMLERLKEIVDEADNNPSPKGIILTGEGRFFSSGFDLPIFINFKDRSEAEAFFDMEEDVLLSLFSCSKPVVAAINGHAAAGGLIYAMAADYRIAADHPKIKIGMSENRIGLPLTITQDEVMRYGLDSSLKFRNIMFFAEMMDVYRAKKLKIVDEVVPEEELIDRAKEIIAMWIDTPGRPFMRMKELMRMDTACRIRDKLKQENWHDGLNCFFKDDVRQALKLVQASMQK